ncbi:hypothetical protein SteCoe_11847 [Stentor coeruleus]|uniref:Uncharacterized protein n=1 Tax=Stentor coeruleus TaxID=5963 RepID=A0A1R2CC54_9CILI|nr:hypothetical protein SteCoe_11847 [Stentor coeruleus]
MEYTSWKEKAEILAELRKKHQGIRKEVEILEKHVKSTFPKRNLNQSISQEASNFFLATEKFLRKSEIPEKIRSEGRKLIETHKKAFESKLKSLNLDFETLAVTKLIELYKLQVKINEMVEKLSMQRHEELKTQIQILNEKIKDTESQFKSSQESPRTHAYDKTIEISNSMFQIKQKNSEFVNALKENLHQLSLILRPNIEKSLNFLVLIQQKLPPDFAIEFSNEKSDIESSFRDVCDYIESFYLILDDFYETEGQLGRFSEISNEQNSIHKIETKDISMSKDSSICASPTFEEFGKRPETLLKVIDMELESDKESIKNLKNLIMKIENERKNLDKICRKDQKYEEVKQNCDQKINILTGFVEEILQTLKKTIISREKRMKLLQNSSSFDKNISKDAISLSLEHSKPPSAARLKIPADKHLNCARREPIDFKKIIESREDTEKIWSPESYDFFADQNSILSLNSESETSNFEIPSPNQELPSNYRIRSAEPGEETMKSYQTFLNLTGTGPLPMLKIPEITRIHQPKLPQIKYLLSQITQLKSSLFSLKSLCSEDFSNMKLEIQRHMLTYPSEIFALQRSMSKNYQIEIEELIDSNDGLRSQIEALKEAFQTEVRTLNVETSELKKMNKDLKESLLKLSNKYEIQNKFITEIMTSVPRETTENLTNLKDYILSILNIYKKITNIYKETNPELLLKIISEEAKIPNNQQSESIILAIENYLKQDRHHILDYLKKQNSTLCLQIVETGQVLEKNFKSISSIAEGFLDEKIMKIEQSMEKLAKFKILIAKYMGDYAQEIQNRENDNNELNEKVESLERQVIKMKLNEKEMQCVISSKTIEMQESNEDFNTLQEFSDNCVRVIEQVNLELKDKKEWEHLTLAMNELLELHRQYYPS